MAYVALGALAMACVLIVIASIRARSFCQTCGAKVARDETMCADCRSRRRTRRTRGAR